MKDSKKDFTIAMCNITNLVSFGCKEEFKEPIVKWLERLQELYDNEDKAFDKACNKLAHLLYDYEDEEDNECQGVNVACSCYSNKAKDLKEKYMSEVKK